MRNYLFVEFVAQDDDVFKAGREDFLGRVAVVPDLGLAEEIEPGALDDANASRVFMSARSCSMLTNRGGRLATLA
jgi:hypothetical protein